MLLVSKVGALFICLGVAVLLAGSGWAATISLSGGGTDVIYNAIQANLTTGATLLITDSGTYTETQVLEVAPQYNSTNGRRAFHIEASAGTTPSIVLNGGRISAYAGGADVHIGTTSGGTISIDAKSAGAGSPPVWYIGQESGLTSGTACQMVIENVNFDFTGKGECILFGAGGNDAAPLTTGASLTVKDVTTRGGDSTIKSLYGPATYASTLTLEGCRILESVIGVEAGAYGLGGDNSVANISHSIIYTSPAVSGDCNGVVGRLGQVLIDHCDVVNEGSASSRGVCITGGTCAVTNSIVHGDAGTVAFGGTGTVNDSNVTGRALVNSGFTYSNYISEVLADTYMAYGLYFSNADNFRVKTTAASYSLGSSPPLGSVGGGGEGLIISLSGGGSGLIAAAIASATKTGGTILLTDSAKYTETQNLLFGQPNNPVYGRRSFNLEASPGTTPEIVFNGGRIIVYAGSKDLQLGSSKGGRISIDCTQATAPCIWYIGQESGLTSGIACQMVMENLEIDVTDQVEAIIFGAGGNDEAPNTTGASLALRGCTVLGGGSFIGGGGAVRSLYKPSTYASKVMVENSIFINPICALELGALQLGGDSSILEMTRTIVYVAPDLACGDSNCVVGRLGHIDINHCDLIHEASNPSVIASRAVTLVQALPEFVPTCDIKNSIIYGDAGTIAFVEGADTVTDSNVTARTVPNVGFAYTNCIAELPVDTYVAYGLDFNNKSNFIVKESALSYTHGNDPPLGALTPKPTAIQDWALY